MLLEKRRRRRMEFVETSKGEKEAEVLTKTDAFISTYHHRNSIELRDTAEIRT